MNTQRQQGEQAKKEGGNRNDNGRHSLRFDVFATSEWPGRGKWSQNGLQARLVGAPSCPNVYACMYVWAF